MNWEEEHERLTGWGIDGGRAGSRGDGQERGEKTRIARCAGRCARACVDAVTCAQGLRMAQEGGGAGACGGRAEGIHRARTVLFNQRANS